MGLIGLGLIPVFLAERNPRTLLGLGLTALSTFALMQSPDLFILGEPFVQLRGYIAYNAEHAGNTRPAPGTNMDSPCSVCSSRRQPDAPLGRAPSRAVRGSHPMVAHRHPVLVFLLFHSLFSKNRNASSSRSFPP